MPGGPVYRTDSDQGVFVPGRGGLLAGDEGDIRFMGADGQEVRVFLRTMREIDVGAGWNDSRLPDMGTIEGAEAKRGAANIQAQHGGG